MAYNKVRRYLPVACWSIEKLKQWAINMDEEEKRLETTKNVLLIKTAVYVFIIVFVITIIVRLAG